jgi:argininosuccinate synthase
MKRIVLAYSGSLASSAAVAWLREQHGAEIVTVTLDLGQERELAAVRERALALGAVRAHVVDGREELVRDYLLPALAAGALESGSLLVHPAVAKRLVDVARMESASAVAHAAAAESAAGGALDACIASLDPALAVIAPPRAWNMSAGDLLAYAQSHRIPVPPPLHYRVDASTWGRVVEPAAGASLPDDALTLTRAAEDCPSDPATLDIEFAGGLPVSANGIEMSMLELIESLETIAGAHGVGRWQRDGTVVEAPAAAILATAHRALETLVVGDDLARLKAQLGGIYKDVLARGEWFSPRREAIDAFASVVQTRVTGSVRLELLKGSCTVVSRTSPYALTPGAPAQPKVVA